MTAAPDALERFGAAYLRLSFGLDAAAEAQWKPGETVRPADDPGIRGKGHYSDPTFNAASDDRRLRLREAVKKAERARARALRAMDETESALRDALASSGLADA